MNLWSNLSGIMQKFCVCFYFLFWGPSWITINMFFKITKELVQTSVHRNGINIAVKTRVEGINSGTLANGNHWTRQPCGLCDSFHGKELPSATLRRGLVPLSLAIHSALEIQQNCLEKGVCNVSSMYLKTLVTVSSNTLDIFYSISCKVKDKNELEK